jgi:hypothetical protein
MKTLAVRATAVLVFVAVVCCANGGPCFSAVMGVLSATMYIYADKIVV